MSYYQTYRPQRFEELVGQDQICQILQSALQRNRLVHAYLFAGTRGTGKTTTARLLAKAVNCLAIKPSPQGWLEPCNTCELCQAISAGNCLDVIEIDAASNRGIEEIRQLQEQGRFKPQQAKKKIFIIDEAHMLTKEAFNALLKTLEEPPDHLLFVLATTEAHKLPATILSRCQRFDFQSPNQATLQLYLERLAEKEKIPAEPAALQLLADLAHGSFRDAATLLEQLTLHKEALTTATVTKLLGLPAQQLLDRYLRRLAGQPDAALFTDLETYFQRGGNPVAFLDSLFQRLAIQVSNGDLAAEAAPLLARLTQLKYQLKQSPIGSLPLLVAIAEPKAETPPPKVHQTVKVTVAEQVPPAVLPKGELSKTWQAVLTELAAKNQSSLVAILRTARPLAWETPIFKIGVHFKFHADQLARQRNRDILEAILADILGDKVRIEPEVEATADLVSAAEELAI